MLGVLLLIIRIPICREKVRPVFDSTCKYFEKTEEGDSSCVLVLFLNRSISYMFAMLLAYMHVLFELCIHVEPTSVVF